MVLAGVTADRVPGSVVGLPEQVVVAFAAG